MQRVVVRNGFSHDLAQAFLEDLRTEVGYLNALTAPHALSRHGNPASTTDNHGIPPGLPQPATSGMVPGGGFA